MILQLLKKYWYWIAMIVMAILIIGLSFSQCRKCPEGITIVITDTIYDSIPHFVEVPKPYPVTTILPGDTFWPDVDTAIILQKCKEMYKDYYSKKLYSRAIIDNKDLYVSLDDTVYMNSLQKANATWKIRRPEIVNTTTTIYGEIPRNKFYVGAGIGYSHTTRIPLSVLMTTKKNLGFEIQTDVIGLIKKDFYLEGKVFYKLSFRK